MSRCLLKILWLALLAGIIAILLWCYFTYTPYLPVTQPAATLVIEDELAQEALENSIEDSESAVASELEDNESEVNSEVIFPPAQEHNGSIPTISPVTESPTDDAS